MLVAAFFETSKKMTKLLLLALLIATQMKNVICDKNAEVSRAANCFALNIYKQLANDQPKSNMVSSPFSFYILLSMLMIGTRGSTSQQLRRTLGYKEVSNVDVERSFKSKLPTLNNNGNILTLANAIWIQKDYSIKESYKDIINNYFYQTLPSADFQNEARKSTEEINRWIKAKTVGFIPKLFDQDMSSNTVMALLNAIYFKGKWEFQFKSSSTKVGKFFSSRNSSTTTKFMNQLNSFGYRNDTNLRAEILEMNFKGNDMSMMILLPKEGTTLKTMEGKMTCGNFKNGLRSGITSVKVDVSVPKFDITSRFNLIKYIKRLGITKIFSSGADFSSLTENDCLVTEAIHNAVIKVNEDGNEAAAVPGANGNLSAPTAFKANRPFVFLIRHKPSDLVLFMGKVEKLP